MIIIKTIYFHINHPQVSHQFFPKDAHQGCFINYTMGSNVCSNTILGKIKCLKNGKTNRQQEGLSVVIKLWFLDQQQHHLGVSQNVHPWAPPTWVFTSCSCDSRAHSITGLKRPSFLLGHTPHPDEIGTGYQGKQGQSSSLQPPLLTFDPRITALKKQLCFNLKNPPFKLPLSPYVCNMLRFLSNPPCFLVVCYVSVITYFLLPTV